MRNIYFGGSKAVVPIPADHVQTKSRDTDLTSHSAIPELTLDTNLIFEYLMKRPKSKVVKSLLKLATSRKVNLAVTARIHEDVPFEPLASKLNALPLLGISEAGSVARLGFWVLGRDMLGDPAFDDYHVTASALAKQRGEEPPDWRDWDHLHSHFLQGRDYFLTWDKGILCLEQELHKLFGIIVLLPEAALERLPC